ncbi:MAG TPA: ATP-binding protein [bacterium]|nr:ATP-binding protein [bacterium]HPN44858.1 ATP-binding protein [bacterium]
MALYTFINTLGFGFGTALTVIIFSLTLKKKPKHYDDYALVILLVACALWLGGNFLSLINRMLFGKVVLLETNILIVISYLGLALIPSAMMNTLAAFFHRAKRKLRPWIVRHHTLLIVFTYLPVFVFLYFGIYYNLKIRSLYVELDEAIRFPYYLWMLFAITFSLILSENLARTHENEADRHFYRDLSITLALIGVGIIVILIIPTYKISYIGYYLGLLMLLSPTLPMAVLGYYVYRYNFYRLVIKPSLIYSIIYGALMTVYLLGIRRLGEYLKLFPEINSTFIEGLLLVALVFAFQPFREAFQKRLDRIFFKDRYFYQQILRELSDNIIGIVDLEKLLNTISESLKSAFKVKSLTIVVFQSTAKKQEILKTIGNQDLKDFFSLIDAFTSIRALRLRQQIKTHLVINALKNNKLELAVPIFYRKKMTGMICLSGKQSGNPFSEEEIDMLQTFANQVALAIENARLVQERLNLEARVYQAEKLNSLGQLATTMSHEIKNPLSSIKSIVQVLHENANGDEAQDLQIVIEEINRLHTVLEKLLSFARPSTANVEEVSLAEIVQDVVDLLKYQANRNQTSIVFQTPEINMVFWAKKQSLREIIYNLVLNAIQSVGSKGEIVITLEQQAGLDKIKKASRRVDLVQVKNWFILKVKDNGPGITKENIKQIFEPFFTTRTKGTGLGLAIVKQNVEELGGFIDVKSDVNAGAEFLVYFPVNKK